MKTKVMTMMALLLLSVTSVMGQEGKYSLGHGYRGFVEIEEYDGFEMIQLSTTHGYQFNPNFFAGVGVGFVATMGGAGLDVIADFRYDTTIKGKYTPFLDLKLDLGDDNFTIFPSIGYRMKHFNVKVGYRIQTKADNFCCIAIGWDFGGRKKK